MTAKMRKQDSEKFGKVQTLYLLLSVIFAVMMIILALIGGATNYSSIPYWDMWNGTYQFYIDLKAGQSGALWAQHNEHRIILSRLLFWIDYSIFGGKSVFLIVMNYVILGAALIAMVQYIKRLSSGNIWNKPTLTLVFFLSAWMFTWTQHENLTWAFQSQFFLSQTLALIAFFFLALSALTQSRLHFGLAYLFGVLSVGAMANGILTLPLMFVLSLILPFNIYRRATLMGLAIIMSSAYFYGYHSPPNHPDLLTTLSTTPYDMFKYLSYYLGSPFHALMMNLGFSSKFSALISVSCTVALIGFSTWALLGQLRSRKKDGFILALLFFILYVGGTAFITAGGRTPFGLNTAFSSRYATPAVFGFSALFILMFFTFRPQKNKLLYRLFTVGLTLLGGMSLYHQFGALETAPQKYQNRNLAALALAMNINDEDTIKSIFPSSEFPLSVTQTAMNKGYGIFGAYPFSDIRKKLGQVSTIDSQGICLGALDKVAPIAGAPDYASVTGWIFDSNTKTVPQRIDFLNSQNLSSGFALTGLYREDVAQIIDPEAELSGFQGYVKVAALTDVLTTLSAETGCKIPFAPKPLSKDYIILTETPQGSLTLDNYAAISDVLSNQGWDGADYAKSSLDGFTVKGSLITSDADTGSLKIKMLPGTKIFYRSGPVQDRQKYRVVETGQKGVLPRSENWTSLIFAPHGITESFEIEFIDNGDDWGEWSAVALQNQLTD